MLGFFLLLVLRTFPPQQCPYEVLRGGATVTELKVRTYSSVRGKTDSTERRQAKKLIKKNKRGSWDNVTSFKFGNSTNTLNSF